MTVQGSGLATGTPDTLTLTVSVNVSAASAQASLADDNTRASALTAALQQGGVVPADIQTSNLSVQPNYNLQGYITGYGVSDTLTAQLHDFATAGATIDAVVAAAGNAAQIQSLSFSIKDPRGIEDQARTDAVQQAVSHARSMALAAGERLGPVCSLTDESNLSIPQPYSTALGQAANAPSGLPLRPGSQQATAQVSVVYALEMPGTRR